MITKGLIIREPWIGKILAGTKTWEMRGKPIKQTGTIALIQQGTKLVVGVATVGGSLGPFSRDEMLANIGQHGIPREMIESGEVDKWNHAWVLKDVQKLDVTIPSGQKRGAVGFANLSDEARQVLEIALR